MTNVYISYRRQDDSGAGGYASWLYDSLARTLGSEHVFMNVDSLPGGSWVAAVEEVIRSCEVVVVLIGKGWLEATDPDGGRRLDAPDDSVRVEIAAAMRNHARVIPVLVHGATMPSPNELPTEIAPLARRSAFMLNPRGASRWGGDAISDLIAMIGKPRSASSSDHMSRSGLIQPAAPGPSESEVSRATAPRQSGARETRVFVNYRREDTPDAADRVADRLRQQYGRENVFVDIDRIDPGADFVEEIERWVASCDAFVALIGPRWLVFLKKRTPRRFRLRRVSVDYVRVELETSLRRAVRVVPVLVHGAKMPAEERLPESLRPLTRRNALDLDRKTFEHDMQRLIATIDGEMAANRAVTP